MKTIFTHGSIAITATKSIGRTSYITLEASDGNTKSVIKITNRPYNGKTGILRTMIDDREVGRDTHHYCTTEPRVVNQFAKIGESLAKSFNVGTEVTDAFNHAFTKYLNLESLNTL